MKKQAKWLVVDTSTGTMAGAIVDGEQLLASVQTEAERNHSIHIMTNIEVMLTDSGLSIHELDGIATGIGPGSYTGVRIAVTATKTLAWTCNKPLVGISSLAGLAISGVLAEARDRGVQGYDFEQVVNAIVRTQAQQENGQGEADQQQAGLLVLPLMDARRGQVYTAAFELGGMEQDGSLCRRVHHDHIVLMEQWCQQWSEQLAQLQARGITTIALFGDATGHEASINNLQRAAAQYGINVLVTSHLMNGEALGLLARGEWLNERLQPEEQHDLVPNYAQLTEAEVKQNEKERGAGRA